MTRSRVIFEIDLFETYGPNTMVTARDPGSVNSNDPRLTYTTLFHTDWFQAYRKIQCEDNECLIACQSNSGLVTR